MPTGAGNTRGSTGSALLAQLAMAAVGNQGVPQDGGVPAPGGSTNSGLDIGSLLAAIKNGQVSAGSLIQLLSLLFGQGMNPMDGGGMSALQNAGQGGPPGGRGSARGPGGAPGIPGGPSSPISAAFMGGGAGGQ